METPRNKKILIADGVSPNSFSIGLGNQTTTLATDENNLTINKPVIIPNGTQDNEAVNNGQLEGRIDDVIDIIKDGLSPFADIQITADEFVAVDDRYKYTVSKSKYGYTMATVGAFGSVDAQGKITAVVYDTDISENGDVDIYISTEPFNAVARMIFGGLDPNYINFSNQFSVVNLKLEDLQNQINVLENKTEIVSEPSVAAYGLEPTQELVKYISIETVGNTVQGYVFTSYLAGYVPIMVLDEQGNKVNYEMQKTSAGFVIKTNKALQGHAVCLKIE